MQSTLSKADSLGTLKKCPLCEKLPRLSADELKYTNIFIVFQTTRLFIRNGFTRNLVLNMLKFKKFFWTTRKELRNFRNFCVIFSLLRKPHFLLSFHYCTLYLPSLWSTKKDNVLRVAFIFNAILLITLRNF